MRKRHSADFKARVVLEAIKENKTMAELSSKHGVHRVQIQTWKKQVVSSLPDIFSMGKKKTQDTTELIDELYKQVGKLKVENDWLKKKSEAFND